DVAIAHADEPLQTAVLVGFLADVSARPAVATVQRARDDPDTILVALALARGVEAIDRECIDDGGVPRRANSATALWIFRGNTPLVLRIQLRRNDVPAQRCRLGRVSCRRF